MKKQLLILIIIILAFTLCACGAENTTENDSNRMPSSPEEAVERFFTPSIYGDYYVAMGIDMEKSYKTACYSWLSNSYGGSLEEFKEQVLHDFPISLAGEWVGSRVFAFFTDMDSIEAAIEDALGSKTVEKYRNALTEADSAEEFVSILVDAKLECERNYEKIAIAGNKTGENGKSISEITKYELAGEEYSEAYNAIAEYLANKNEDGYVMYFSIGDIERIYVLSCLMTMNGETAYVRDGFCAVGTKNGCFVVIGE